MSRELHIIYDNSSSPTIYCCLREPSTGKVWYADGPAFETWGTAGRTAADYDNAVTHRGGGFWTADFWTDIEAGDYTIVYYQQLGAAPADSDTPIAQDYGRWTGTLWVSSSDMISGPGQSQVTVTIRTTAGTALENISVWLSDQNDSSDTVAIVQPRITDAAGQVTFYLTLGETYYLFCGSNAYTFAAATLSPVSGTVSFTEDIATAVSSSGSSTQKTCVQLIERVLYLIGRKNTTGALPLDSIILDALNEAQRKIVQRVPHALDLQVEDATTFQIATNDTTIDLSTLTDTISHVHRIWVLNGLSTSEICFMQRDHFRRHYPVVSAIGAGLPSWFTRFNDVIEFSCPFSSDYNDLYLRVDYTKAMTVFTSTSSVQTSDLADVDDGLILWGQVKALRAVAKGNSQLLATANLLEQQWNDWLDEFETRNDLETEENLEDFSGEMLLYDE